MTAYVQYNDMKYFFNTLTGLIIHSGKKETCFIMIDYRLRFMLNLFILYRKNYIHTFKWTKKETSFWSFGLFVGNT